MDPRQKETGERENASRTCPKTGSDRPLALGKKLLFAVLTLLVFFVVLETTLALIGIQPAYRTGDPLVGFSGRLPHFVETKDASGQAVVRTAPGKEALNEQGFRTEKPAGTFRVVCLGGSTTYGRPFWDATSFSGWLRAYLPAADDTRNWEVINAGGISYASYRVLSVAEELAPYSPDLFVVYLGHNEFLERRTYGDLLERPELLKDVQASAYRLRTATLIQRIAGGFSGRNRTDEKPIVMGEDVDRIPLNAVGPDAYHRDDRFKEQVIGHFRLSLTRLLEVAERCGAKVVLVAPASNYRHAKPFKNEHTAGLTGPLLDEWRSAFREAISALQAEDYSTAHRRLERCRAINPRHAATHYHLGQTLLALDRPREARAAFRQAIEEDICPLRAIDATLTTLQATAAARAVPLIDFQAVLEARSEFGITGENFFHDHLHLTIEANRILALEIITSMEEQGWLAPKWTPGVRREVEQQVHAGLDRDRYARELCKLSYAMDSIGQDHMALASVREALELGPDHQEVLNYALPFYSKKNRFEEIARLLEARTGRAPQDRRALSNLGETYLKMNRFAEAAGAFERLLALDPQNVEILQRAGVARSKSGHHERAAAHLREAARLNPQSAQIQNNLGLVLATGGEHEVAIPHFERAVAQMPSLASAHFNWALSLVELNRKEEAIEKFTRVLKLRPAHRGAADRLKSLKGAP